MGFLKYSELRIFQKNDAIFYYVVSYSDTGATSPSVASSLLPSQGTSPAAREAAFLVMELLRFEGAALLLPVCDPLPLSAAWGLAECFILDDCFVLDVN